MSKTLDQLSQIIAKSSIALEDQNDLLLVLPALPEEALLKLIEIFQKDPRWSKNSTITLKLK